ncbi:MULTISPECIES: hypothetical protein [Marinobacter]|uniref:hypothetical protein n=1 Tax=Marinobacter TaxID=2742 RepID=UPI00177A800A|nr:MULTISPECIES: hypothetical protein [Marinobacter]MBL3557594.1 hypothetical protein [Marinobacter sp. JB05H06]
MKVTIKNGEHQLRVKSEAGAYSHINIHYLSKAKDWEPFAQHAVNYCTGKKPISIKSWWSRLNSVLRPTIIDSEMRAFPKKANDWSTLIRNLYLTTLITPEIKSSIYTRVAIWNKNILPFLVYLQDRDQIPIEVLIPTMKQVDQVQKNSSFNVSVIGEKAAYKVNHKDQLDKLICPVSLSRTDSEYLDELYYDLERKRNNLHRALADYWKTLKEFFETGQKLLSETDLATLERRIKAKDLYDIYPRENGIPPIRRQFSSGHNRKSFAAYLLLSKKYKGFIKLSSKIEDCGLASRSVMRENKSLWMSQFPPSYIEKDKIGYTGKLNWMLGLLGNMDVSFIVALLMMENPKFTFLSLLNCKIEDKDGKSRLEIGETSISFTIEKSRAKAFKKEGLSSLSLEIITTLLEMRAANLSNIPTDLSKYLFVILAVNSKDKIFTCPQNSRVTAYLTGREDGSLFIGSLFPSLADAGISRNQLTHSKLRASEGVLEYFRTGSIRAVSRKLGNGTRVALEHYLPKPLIAAYNTRQVRRFQNLMLVSACANEDYLLDAVDFCNLNELHSFILEMLDLDSKGNNPLINYLKDEIDEKHEKNQGDLIANISEKSLTVLYAYKLVAENKNLSASTLAQKDSKTGLAPIAFITLAKHLNNTLSQHNETSVRETNFSAKDKALLMAEKLEWDRLIMRRANIS